MSIKFSVFLVPSKFSRASVAITVAMQIKDALGFFIKYRNIHGVFERKKKKKEKHLTKISQTIKL